MNRIYWTHNLSTGHIRIRIHSINLIISLILFLNSPDLFLSVFVTETTIYNNGPIDISDTFKLLYFVQKMWKYASDVNISETCIDAI